MTQQLHFIENILPQVETPQLCKKPVPITSNKVVISRTSDVNADTSHKETAVLISLLAVLITGDSSCGRIKEKLANARERCIWQMARGNCARTS